MYGQISYSYNYTLHVYEYLCMFMYVYTYLYIYSCMKNFFLPGYLHGLNILRGLNKDEQSKLIIHLSNPRNNMAKNHKNVNFILIYVWYTKKIRMCPLSGFSL